MCTFTPLTPPLAQTQKHTLKKKKKKKKQKNSGVGRGKKKKCYNQFVIGKEGRKKREL